MLIRDRIAMEKSRNLDTVMFDKTDTLTKGKQGVVGVETAGDWSEERVFEVAAGVEGDSEDVAKAVSEELGIDQYFAEVLPEEKDNKVEQLQSEGKLVTMVGSKNRCHCSIASIPRS